VTDEPIRVLIVDDDPFVTQSLATILSACEDVVVVGTGRSAVEAARLWEALAPDVGLLDIQLHGPAVQRSAPPAIPVVAPGQADSARASGPAVRAASADSAGVIGSSGLDAGRAILARWPGARIVFLTTFVDDSYITAALRMGAKGYLVKQDVAAIASALRTVMAGESVFGAAVVGRFDGLLAPTPPVVPADGLGLLTEREAQIAALVSQGLDNREIAEAAFLSEGTVRNVVSAILGKLGLRSRTAIAAWYLRRPGPR
jgi:DNA-binding NarL/FixJ family response regulator